MTTHRIILASACCSVVCSVASGIVAYALAVRAPAAPQVAVVNGPALARSLQREHPSLMGDSLALHQLLDEKFKPLTSTGVVVLDASQCVVSAPKEAYVAVGPQGSE